MPISAYRYQLQPYKGGQTRIDCPNCGPRHKRTFVPYVDTQTGEPLPEAYGRCNRESNCGYHLSPYHKSAVGMSYADEVYQRWKEDNTRPAARQHGHANARTNPKAGVPSMANPSPGVSSPPCDQPVYVIPDEVFDQSIGHYDRNQFAQLLRSHFGMSVADGLLLRFQIGTSSRWPGACVFWYVDEQGRKRGGQIKQFGDDWHTAKYVDHEGETRSKTSWVHSALIRRYKAAETPAPDWLNEYEEKAERSPCLFGLPQLLTAPADQPIAIVEAPKTAVLCTPYFAQFIWLAIGGLSYLTTNTDIGLQRLAPLKGRNVVLFPDLAKNGSAFIRWSRIADELRQDGFMVIVSDYLEQLATDEERAKGLDLADYLLTQWKGYPPCWDD